ncbi:SPOR domain-containing protein [Roseibaca sp. Y0-43]|uniref:SPOR domain-containing protein n=1 Tax=Roseibaca sp. Y0-43 TaxID=2816854 RepID=UPI001D956D29|nr:SPOR domain-containing protein [Roseibaca sp. Y0-43]
MSRSRVVGFSLVLCLGLSACMDGTGGTQSAPTGSPRAGEVIERDVEAPDVFSKRDQGLWDGRPSLGGVWVAHPDVDAPERVIIRNRDSGQETIGALFKRERMNPGPRFQVSAEAADAVGMLAGAPTNLEVVALRTEEIQTAPEPVAEPEPQAEAVETEVAAVAPAAEQPAAPAPTPQAEVNTPADAGDDTLIAMPEAEEPKRGGFFSRLFGRSNRAEAESTGAPLDATAPLEGAAQAAPDTTAPLPMPTPLSSGAASAPAPASTLDRPFVQIGIFSVESNANNAARTMRNAGLSAAVKPGSTQGNSFWRVVVGPAATEAQRREILAQVRRLGFADAYAVRR